MSRRADAVPFGPVTARTIRLAPLTPSAFAPFGTVIDKSAVAPRPMNAGKARRYHDLAQVMVTGDDSQVVTGHVEAEPYALPLRLTLVERHPPGAQAFVPLDAAPFLVVVCPDEGGRPGRHWPFSPRWGRASAIRSESGTAS